MEDLDGLRCAASTPCVDASAPPKSAKWSAEQIAKMRRFAAGRVTAEGFADPMANLTEVWAPKVAGMYVRVAGQHYGFVERADALKAGRGYRESCRRELASLDDGALAPHAPADAAQRLTTKTPPKDTPND